jgi:NHLM bacteriocin system ABC transporter peptidase/ATP-binding protein
MISLFRRRWFPERSVRRTATVLQMEAVECGVAALAMVLAYHGRRVPLEELRVACGVSRDGAKASNLIAAGRRYGLAGKGFKKEPEELGELPLPSIIHWNFNHFVVYEGARGDYAYLNDPAIGRRRIPLDELSESFTGVVLAFETTALFERRGAPPRALPMMRRALAGSGAGLSLVVLISLMLVLPAIIVPALAKLFVDDVLIAGNGSWLAPLLIGMALTAALRALILALRQHYLLRLEGKLGLTMASKFVWHVLRLPMGFFTQRHAGDVVSRITVNEEIAQLLSGELATTMLHVASLVLYAAVMATYDLLLTAIAVPLALVSLLALRLVSRLRQNTARRLAQVRGKLEAATVATIHSIESIKSIGVEQDAFARWAGYHAKAMDAAQELDRQGALVSIVPQLLTALGAAAVLGVGSLRVMQGAMSVGDLVAFQTLMASFSEPIARLVTLSTRWHQAKAGLARIADVLAYPEDRRVSVAGPESPAVGGPVRLDGTIELRNVTFGYNPNEPPLIENFNLTVRPGQRVALVGGSGSGKSTLGRLICGLYSPWSGEILFDGRPLTEISPAVLASSLSYVDQDITLFAGTLRDNLTLWDDSVEEPRLSQALRDVALFDEILLRSGIYDYRLAEGGIDFSGGQRQRLEIARALVNEPSILVLDEATAALDPLVEEQIDENIRRRGCTCVIIAHRYSTIRDADQIIVLADGGVEGHGTHAQLMASCPVYAELLHAE